MGEPVAVVLFLPAWARRGCMERDRCKSLSDEIANAGYVRADLTDECSHGLLVVVEEESIRGRGIRGDQGHGVGQGEVVSTGVEVLNADSDDAALKVDLTQVLSRPLEVEGEPMKESCLVTGQQACRLDESVQEPLQNLAFPADHGQQVVHRVAGDHGDGIGVFLGDLSPHPCVPTVLLGC